MSISEAKIRVLHVTRKVAKNGNPYSIVYCLVTIDGNEFMQSFTCY